MPPSKMKRDKTYILERIKRVQRVEGFSECWEWQLSTDTFGHGNATDVDGKKIGAHRLSWIIFCGPIKDCVLHKCDNPPCVRPSHLFEGSNGDNDRDTSNKGRIGKSLGSKHGMSKLSEEEVLEIKSLLKKGRNQRKIAKRFGVSFQLISRINVGKNWTHL